MILGKITETSVMVQVQLAGFATEPISSVTVEVFNSRMELVSVSNQTGPFARGGLIDVTVNGLSASTHYSVVAYGVNAGGPGQRSEQVSFNTRE